MVRRGNKNIWLRITIEIVARNMEIWNDRFIRNKFLIDLILID